MQAFTLIWLRKSHDKHPQGSDVESGGLTTFCNTSFRAQPAEPSSHHSITKLPEHHSQREEVGRAHQDAEQEKCPQHIGKNNIH